MSNKIVTRRSAAPQDGKCSLRLYVAGCTAKSSRAIKNLKAICETHFKGRYDLTVVDLYKHQKRAREDQIVMAPTLVRHSPLPVRRMVGDLSQTERVLAALDFASSTVSAIRPGTHTNEQLGDQVVDLRARLDDEANKVLRTVRIGEVDAVLVQGLHGDQLFTLNGADESYRVLVEEMNQGAVTLSADGSILYCNRRFADLLKTPIGKIVGLDFSAFVAPSERAGFADLLEAGRLGGSAGEITLSAGDESAVPLQLALGPLPAGSAAAICLVATDIRESREKEEAKDRFLATMSHELRTPLNGIIGFAEFLVDGKPGTINAKQKEYLEDILNSSKHLLWLINDILDLAKVGAGKMEFYPERFSLRKAIRETCSASDPIAQKRSIHMDVTVAPKIGDVTLDQQKFKQVLFNLLSNAIKFSHDGGEVGISVEPYDTDRLKLVVSDSGIGIKAEDVGRLFNQFEQLESGASRHHEGTGLGLALTRKIVEFQGGNISVDSQLGKGSDFTVVLPLVHNQGQPTVLVVDDDPDLQELFKSFLKKIGFSRVVVGTAKEAIASLRKQKFDLMFLDLQLPDAPGDQVYKAAKQIDPDLNVIVITGYPDSEMLDRILQISPVTVLKKPLKIEQLNQTVKILGHSITRVEP